MDFLSDKGMRFESAFANGPFTSAAFLSILASAYPLEFKDQIPLPPDAILISEALRKNGIRTAAIHSNPYLSTFYGYDRGWHYFQDFLPSVPNKGLKRRGGLRRSIKKYVPKRILKLNRLSRGLYRLRIFFGFARAPFENAETITKCAISWLNENKDFPFFLWLHYMDLHEPYWVFDAKFKRKYSKKVSGLSRVKMLEDAMHGKWSLKSVNRIIDVYDDRLSYVDESLKELFHFLDNEGLIGDTLIVLTSDHGQGFLDHGFFGHIARFYDEHLHIPLILFGPGIRNQVNSSLVSQLDIAPTILNFYGVTVQKDYRGHNLLLTNRFVISEAAHNEKGVYIASGKIFPSNFRTYAIRTKKWKYIYGEKQREMYNLEKDPKEMKNVADREEAKAKEFESIIRQHVLWEEKMRKQRAMIYEKERISKKIKKLKSIGKICARAEEEKEIKKRLSKLGYI